MGRSEGGGGEGARGEGVCFPAVDEFCENYTHFCLD